MKKLLALLLTGFFLMAAAQSEPVLHYKFLITDGGTPVSSAVNLKFRIKDGSTVLWEEEHTGVTPDANGIASIDVGTGTQTGGTLMDISDVDWSQDLTYDVDVDLGSGYVSMVSDAAFRYVPKAKYADRADFNGLDNKPVTFLLTGTTDYPSQITDEIYHTGKVSIGTDAPAGIASLYVAGNGNGGASYALKTQIDVASNADKTGIYNLLQFSGDGYLKAIANRVSTTGNGTHVGNWTQMDGNGSGTHLGTYNRMFGDGTGYQTAVLNEIRNTGDDYHVGVYNWITNDGDGEHYGMVNLLTGSGDGLQVGVSTTITNDGAGDKYGTYVYIDSSLPGIHYGIYADVPGDTSYAGYFNGNIFVAEKLKASVSGDADMKPYLYGKVDATGNVDADSSTPGFTVSGSTGHYTVTFDTALPDTHYIVQASIEGNDFGLIRVVKSATGFDVYTADTGGTQAAREFSFVVYRK